MYFVNSFQSELNHINLVETSVDGHPDMMSIEEKMPSDRIIENILNFARSYDAFETKDVGYVEMNLN